MVAAPVYLADAVAAGPLIFVLDRIAYMLVYWSLEAAVVLGYRGAILVKEPVVALQAQMVIQIMLVQLEQIELVAEAHRLPEVFLGKVQPAPKAHLVKAVQLLDIVAVVVVAAGMVAAVLMTVIMMLMDAMAAVAQDMCTHHLRLLIIPLAVYLNLHIILFLRLLLQETLFLLLQQEQAKQDILEMAISVLQLLKLKVEKYYLKKVKALGQNKNKCL